MGANNATIVAASLDSSQLEQSINALVSMVAKKTKEMADNFTGEVKRMEDAVKNLGNIKIDSGGTADGGSSRRTSKQKAEETQIKATTQAYKEQSATLDQQAAAIRKANQVSVRTGDAGSVRNADTLQTMNIQLDLLRERLREARNQYSSFIALASHATTTGDKGLYQFATEGVHKYGDEVRTLIPQIRGLQNAIQQMGDVIAPQGHTIQNYVNSLQKANPELAALNGQFKRGKSLLQQQETEFEKNAQAQRNLNSATNQQKKTLDEMNAYMRQNIQREQERREAIRQTGLAARDTANQLIRAAHEQASAQGSFPITGTKELAAAIEQMRRAYFDMSSSEKMSPIGVALEADIKRANEAITIIRKYNQSFFGVGQNDNTKITNASTLESLRASLKVLTEQYNKLTVAELNAGKGDALIQHFQDTTRAAQILQRTLNRPVSLKAALTGDERTLDDIAYKMQRLRAYKQGIDLTKPNAANEIKQVDEALVRLQKDMDKYLSKSKDVLNSNNALGRSWNYMKNRLAFYFTVGASTQFIKNLIEVRSQYEMNERALGILINSAERGTQIFNELSQMALVSPYTLIELSAAAKQLTAYDVAARDVVDTTRRLADMAAAVGIPIERLTYALGQIKAYGYLNSRDARMFANAGIPLVKQLSEYYTELEGRLVSTADVYDRIKKKSIDYNEVMEVMYKMTDQGGKFFDFQAKMADTLKVRLANLTLAWNNMLNDMGKESQGVLTWGIGALRDLFLRWKDLDNAIKNAAWIVGLKVALDFLLFGLNRAGLALGMWTHKMALSEVVGKRLAATITTIGRSLYSLASSRMTWITLAVMAAIELINALNGANEAQTALNKSIRDGAKDNYDNISKFLEQYKQVRESLYTTQKVAIGNMYDPSTGKASATAYVEQSVEQDIDKNEAKKAWEAIREQIELTTRSSDQYIGRLLEISNMSERVRQGFNILEDVRTVNAALQELDEDTIKIEKDMSSWWNVYQMPDGLIGNIKDYQDELNNVVEKFGSLENLINNVHVGGDNWGDFNDYQTALERLQSSVKTTTDSIINFIELKGWSGDINKINEVFKQIADKIALDNQLDPQKAFVLQTQVEEARSQAAKQALLQRISDEKAALAQASDENQRKALTDSINANVAEYKNWDDYNGRKKTEWERFTKWLKEQHISETTAMFRNMDAEDIKSLNFQEGKYGEYVTRMVEMYAKEHKMSYDEAFNYLKGWVTNANKWSVFIPLIISTEDKKSVYDQLGEYDKAIDDADAQIERLTKRINELNAKKKKSKEETQELANAEQELADAQKAKADAESKGGHGKKEKKDERAAQKAQKQAESELQKALKEELSIIDKIRSNYQALTKEGMSHADAIKASTVGYEKSAKSINQTLTKFGLQAFDPSAFAGISDPNDLVRLLEDQLNKLIRSGKAKPAEIKDLEVKINDVKLDAEKYNLTRITKGLNNELDRLKDEYELAISLDADPELGNMFADWMGIDVNDLPRTATEYANRASKILNSKLKDLGAKTELPNLLSITDDDMRAFESNKTFTDEQLELVKKRVEAAREFYKKEVDDRIKDWDKLLEKYAEYETKVNKIQNDAVKERVTFAQQFGNDEEKSLALNLQTQILAATDPQEKQKLIQQLQELVKGIAGDDKAKLNIVTSIDNSETKGLANVSFEEFQKSPEWITATGELSGMTNKAIGGLIKSLEKYKKSAKNLDPKQIKNINKALKNLYKEQRKGNPFGAIADMLDRAKERMDDVKPEMESIMSDIIALEEEIGDGKATEEQTKKIDKLKERWQTLARVGDVSAQEWVTSITSVYDAVKGAIQLFDDLAKAIGGKNASDIEKVFGVLDKAGQGAQIGASFGGYGAAIGAVAGALTGVITTFADQWSGNHSITKRIKESERAVNRLANAYKELEDVADQAYGTQVVGAKSTLIANKELVLAEKERQLELERSRRSKNKDEDKIISLEGEIIDLKNEIASASKDIVNDLLSISDAGDGIENLVDVMIDAFKNGEDAMKAFGEEWDKMIDNMVLKMLVSQFMQDAWNNVMSILDKKRAEMTEQATKDTKERETMLTQTDDDIAKLIAKELGYSDFKTLRFNEAKEILKRGNIRTQQISEEAGGSYSYTVEAWQQVTNEQIDAYRNMVRDAINTAQSSIDQAGSDYTKWALDYMNGEGRDYMYSYAEMLKNALGDWYTYGQDSKENLSALQQGIQGITEDTAGALEAYMNGVSQQVYLHSDLLTQIRDAVVGFSLDVQVATMSQILLQLQSSYTVQMSIQGILEGWSSPNGMAVRVEMQ